MTDAPPTRKPYRITKQREKWSESEHQRFTEAVDKYGRDWKQIVEHVGTRSVAQVRSHAQKFFLKLEKSGQADVVPPPRPKKRAAKPYPVQDRSEERRKSKRSSRTSNSHSSANSQPSHTRGAAITPSSSPTVHGRSSPRSTATAASLPSSSRPLRSTRRALAHIASKGSCQDLEGNGSNAASGHESNNEHSGAPSANQENSGLSTGGPELDLQLSTHPSSSIEAPQALPRPLDKNEAPDYGKLYSIVNGLFDSGGASNNKNNHKQMMEQLEPDQRKELLAMMDQLTGNLRSTCPPAEKLEQLKAELKAKSKSPSPPKALPALLPAHQRVLLDHAASMPLMPSTACLPMPQNVSEEPLALMRPLPGSQGTALLQPAMGGCSAQCGFPTALPLPTAADANEAADLMMVGGSSSASNLGLMRGSEEESAADAAAALMQQGEPEQSIADQLLGNAPQDEQTLFDIQQGGELDDDAGLLLPTPKQPSLGQGNTPLDTCLAQLESGPAPSVPDSDDFLDSWKIGSSDPVWQTLGMQQTTPAPAPSNSLTQDTNGSMFVF